MERLHLHPTGARKTLTKHGRHFLTINPWMGEQDVPVRVPQRCGSRRWG